MIRLLLHLLPKRFQAVYGEEMRDLFRARLKTARLRGARAVAALYVRTFIDLMWTVVREHHRSSFDPPDLPRPAMRPSGERRGDSHMSTVLYDLRLAARGLAGRPWLSLLVVATLAVGIGANTAIFSVVDGVLLRPLDYRRPGELVRVLGRFDPESGFDFERFPLSVPELVDFRDQVTTLSDVAGYSTESVALTSGVGEPQRVRAAEITPDLLQTLGAEPRLGRDFVPEDGLPGAPRVVILSHGLWQERFAGDPAVIGSDVEISGRAVRVVGVMGPGFEFPGPEQRLWLPFTIDPADPGNRSSHFVSAIGRLAPATSLSRAEAETATLMKGWAIEYPEIHTGHYLYLRPLQADLVRDVRPALLTLMAASTLVLLLACANVAAVLLARGEDRAREVAVRTALGAGRGRVVMLFLGESILLALAGGTVGVGMARLGQRTLLRMGAGDLPRVHEVGTNGSVLLFALAASLATALLSGLVPALRASRVSPRESLHEGGRGSSGRSTGRTLLVTAEVAFCFLLLLGAGLMIRSLGALLAVEPGFAVDGRLVARLRLPAAEYSDGEVVPFYDRLLERARALPGVTGASLSGAVPMLDGYGNWDFDIEGRPDPARGEPAWTAYVDAVYPGFFTNLGIPVLEGRAIDERDGADDEAVAVVNRELVRRFWPDGGAVGARIRVASDSVEWMRIVGVVGDARDALDTGPVPRYYVAARQAARTAGTQFRTVYITLTADDEPTSLLPELRRVLREMDPRLPLYDVHTLRGVVAASAASRRYTGTLMTVFALVALVLGASGTYGVLAYSVAQRGRELGIRKALGATPGRVLRMVVAQGLVPVCAGIVLGAVGSVWAMGLIGSQLFGVTAADPVAWSVVLATLVLVALLACAVPASRAVRIAPASSLRTD